MRNIPETGIKCDFCNGCALMSVIQQIPGTNKDPQSVDVFSDRATRGGKKFVHVSLRAVEFQRECVRVQLGVIDVAIDMIKHHRQQDRPANPLRCSFLQNAWRVRYQVDDMLGAEGTDSRVRLRTKTQFCMSRECPGQRPAGLGRGKPQPRPLCERAWQELSRHRKTKQAEIPAIRDFEWLGRVDDREISRTANLLVAALSVATNAVELEVDEVHVADASRDMRTQTEHHVLCRFDSGNPN